MVFQRAFPIVLGAILWIGLAPHGGCQTTTLPLLKAASNDELPLPAWGPFSPDHIGPCCLVNRLLLQQFAFPIVISQVRDETMVRSTRGADGKLRTRLTPVVLLRRTLGLAPVRANDDDRPQPGKPAPSNCQARPLEADRDGMLWRMRATFTPSVVAQTVAADPDSAGVADWNEGEADVDYFPAFAEPEGDGLLIRISLTNHSQQRQTYCVDLLGGLDTQTERFARKDLSFETEAQGDSIVLQHPNCPARFALAASPLPYTLRCYQVGDAYFGPLAAVAVRDAGGVLLPEGAQPLPLETPAITNNLAMPWALLRLSGIKLEPGQAVALFLSVGVGADADAARRGARILLRVAEDAQPGTHRKERSRRRRGKEPVAAPPVDAETLEGAYTRALRAHADALWAAKDEVFTRLMAQTLYNAPLVAARRRGIASRISREGRTPNAYDPIDGGLIALALAATEPTYAAAELNIHYWTQADAPPRDSPHSFTPINLFALWDLYERTHDADLLAHFYPSARRDYQEMVAAGRIQKDDWKLAWPTGAPDPIFAPVGAGNRAPASGYSAYVIRTARLLRAMAIRIEQPDEEIKGYTKDIEQAVASLFANGAADAAKEGQPPATVFELLPLIAGDEALPAVRKTHLLAALTDPAQFWSPGGVRQTSRQAAGYRADSPGSGAVRFGMNWLLWKALLDLGESDMARRLADNLLNAYRAAVQASGGCPEWLDGDHATPSGSLDLSGDACGLISIYAAYHLPGTITTGWSLDVLDQRYDATTGSLHLAFRSLEPKRSAALLCALGKPGGVYTLSGALQGPVTADADGVLTLSAPKDLTTQSLDIVPSGAP